MARVTLDADIIIAFLEAGDDQHEKAVRELRPRLAIGEEILVSASVCAEVLVRPLQRGAAGTVDDFLKAIGATIVAVDAGVARRAAQLRADHRALRLPDALSLAVALDNDAELLTLDAKLRRAATQAR
jgi:predicted nucleic acid-binding protein